MSPIGDAFFLFRCTGSKFLIGRKLTGLTGLTTILMEAASFPGPTGRGASAATSPYFPLPGSGRDELTQTRRPDATGSEYECKSTQEEARGGTMATHASIRLQEGSVRSRLPELTHLERERVLEIIASRIQGKARPDRPIDILEAGCGRKWPFALADIRFTLTGVDLDPHALDARRKRGDLHRAVMGDLRSVDLPPDSFDVIYNAFVLEHVRGASEVLENFVRWLRPGGLLILQLPNRDSVYGLCTRMTPLWVHVMYKRYIKHNPVAGKIGHEPYPVFYDEAISRGAIHEFSRENRLVIRDEYSFGKEPRFVHGLMRVGEWLSLGKLSARHLSLFYVLERE